ncbi:biliverdin-producing heme oxygenase [Planctobacterium marinum]|uniref:Heme oxygenase n=1 Tax=Planctobacterium marinum TaxID=1631968 RepID=A0AA48HN55_9ALTE|nr:hypothetical protein MACH26_04400 [Planctobacterium marinum]
MELLAQLRKETQAEHGLIEGTYPFNRLLLPSLEVQEYQQTLALLFRWHQQLESNVLQMMPAQLLEALEWNESTKSLRQDLDEGKTQLPQIRKEFQLGSRDEAIGALYVILGAAMGARVILEHLNKHPVLQHKPHLYYTEMTSRLRKWGVFTHYLRSHCSQIDHQSAVKGAKSAFKLLQQITLVNVS